MIASAALILRLFFEEEYDAYLLNHFTDQHQQDTEGIESLSVAGLFETEEFDLNTIDPFMRFPVSQIYEPLISLDDNLGVRPALALSWGELSPNVWQFKLRENVKFHDGSEFDADDVIASFETAKKSKNSDLAKLLSFVKSIEKSDSHTIQFTLNNVDPLFLVKLSYLLIGSDQPSEVPVGTSKFEYVSSSSRNLSLKAFSDYWEGNKAVLQAIELIYEPNAERRLNLLYGGEVDISSELPLFVKTELKDGYELLSAPRLEMTFLVFNSSSDAFQNSDLKEVMIFAIDRNSMIDLVDNAVLPLYQFAPRGVIGSNPELDYLGVDLFRANEIMKENYPSEILEIDLAYLEGASLLAEHLRANFNQLGIDLIAEELKWEEMETALQSGDRDMYLLSWKFDVPDISEFLKVFVHSYTKDKMQFGTLNGENYRNDSVDELIEKNLSEFNFTDRNRALQDLMKIILKDDPFGLPLWEATSIYAHDDSFHVEPKLDGSIDLAKVTLK